MRNPLLRPWRGAAYRLLALLLVVGPILSRVTVAQEPVPADAGAAPASEPRASGPEGLGVSKFPPGTVRLGNREVATLRAATFGLPPPERAIAASNRLAAIAERGVWGPVVVKEEEYGRAFWVGDTPAFVLTPRDVDEARGETLEQAADRAANRLEMALSEARESRNLPDILKGAGLTVLATVVLVLLVIGIERSRRRFAQRALRAAQRRFAAAGIPGATLLESDHLYVATTRALVIAGRFLELVLLYVWVGFVLRRFAFTRPWGDQLREFLVSTLKELALAAVGWIPNLLVVLIIYAVTRFLIRLVDMVFRAIEDGRIEAAPTLVETAQPTKRIITVIFWLFALIMAYPYLPGSTSEAFKGISVMVGLMVSLGSTALVGQLASGFMLMYSRTFRVGHYIKVGDIEGTVLGLGLFATKIRTVKGEEVTIPNTVVAGTTTLNYSRTPDPDGLILYTSVTIGYDTPWRQVEALLILAAERTAGLKKEPRPFVLQQALNDFYIEYQLNAVIEKPETRIRVLAELRAKIQDTFNEFGVQIMSPHYLGDPAREKVVPKEKWFEPPAQRTENGK